MKKVKLFCFPFAGASATVYNKWKSYLDPSIEIIPVEFAGRGKRMDERMYSDMDEGIQDLYRFVKDNIQGSPYALFGHSMGGMVAFLLAQEFLENKEKPPCHVFISSTLPPNTEILVKRSIDLMSDEELKTEFLNIGSSSDLLSPQPEILELYLPILRNDIRLAQQFRFTEDFRPIDSDISILFGKEEQLAINQCDEWKNWTNKKCRVHYIDGTHGFIKSHYRQVLKLVNDVLLRKTGYI